MAVPKKKKSQSKTRMRRSQSRIELPQLIKCKNCGEANITHRVCPACGYYGGRQIISTKALKKS